MGVFEKIEREKKYITKSRLKGERGWTDLLIKHFLKQPDLFVTNPYYSSQPDMGLYLLQRVFKVEECMAFKQAKVSATSRKASAKKAVETKRLSIMNWVENLQIKLPELEFEDIVKCACNSYNNFSRHLAYDRDIERELATPDSDSTFLNRICLNYLRHECTRYEDQLARIFGKVGTEQAYEALKNKVNETILERYPQLR